MRATNRVWKPGLWLPSIQVLLESLLVRIIVIVAVLIAACAWCMNVARDDVTTDLISEAVAPDHSWNAQVIEYYDHGGALSDVTDEVQIASLRKPAKNFLVLGEDTGGHNDERPLIRWLSPTVLRITVPDMMYVVIHERDFAGIHIDLKVDPDDPAFYAAWRDQMGRDIPPGQRDAYLADLEKQSGGYRPKPPIKP